MSPFQSAHGPGHSTETALLKVINDFLHSLDQGNVSVLTLLGLSAAFDIIDHTILLKRLEHVFFWQTQYCSPLVLFTSQTELRL